jgi:hypothetical protein
VVAAPIAVLSNTSVCSSAVLVGLSSVDPGVVDLLTVGFVVRTENEQLKPVGACFKGSDDLGCDPDRIKCSDIGDLAIELDLTSAGEDHVHLLSTPVAMSERRTFPGTEANVRHASLLGFEIHASDARLPSISKTARRCSVLDIGQIDLRVCT